MMRSEAATMHRYVNLAPASYRQARTGTHSWVDSLPHSWIELVEMEPCIAFLTYGPIILLDLFHACII